MIFRSLRRKLCSNIRTYIPARIEFEPSDCICAYNHITKTGVLDLVHMFVVRLYLKYMEIYLLLDLQMTYIHFDLQILTGSFRGLSCHFTTSYILVE